MKTRKMLLGLAGGGGIAGRLGNVFAWFGFALLAVGATTFPISGVGAIWETQIQEKPVWGPVESCADAADNKQKVVKVFEKLEEKYGSDPSQDLLNKDEYKTLDRLRIKYSSFNSDNCEENRDHAQHYQFKEKNGWYYGTELGLRWPSRNRGHELGHVSWFTEAFPISLFVLASWLVVILFNYILWGAARILPWKKAVPEATEG